MKRTEKIEVRLSHDEKQSLSRIAEGEGRTVSDLVRGLIERYVSMNTSRLPHKRRWGLWTALVASGLLIGHLGTYAFTQVNRHGPTDVATQEFDVYSLSMAFTQNLSNGQLSAQNFEAPIILKNGFEDTHRIEREGNDFQVATKVYRAENDVTRVGIKICIAVVSGCEEIANQLLTIVPTQPASTVITSDNLHMIGIDLNWATRINLPVNQHDS